jgi:hypothetical protein
MDSKFCLTKKSNNDNGLEKPVVLLTEPAKKDVIEALKMLEAIKRKLLILVK